LRSLYNIYTYATETKGSNTINVSSTLPAVTAVQFYLTVTLRNIDTIHCTQNDCGMHLKITPRLEKQQHFVHDFDKFKQMIVGFGKHCIESNAKLTVNYCPPCLFNAATLPCKIKYLQRYCIATQKWT